MSVVDLLKSVDTLAKIINQKNRELDELKKGYDAKLHEINKYVEVLQKLGLTDDKNEVMSEERFRKIIHQPAKCSNCNHEIWNIDGDGELVAIPRKKLQYILQNTHMDVPSLLGGMEDLKIKDNESSCFEPRVRPNFKGNQSSNGERHFANKSKKTCSYCKKTGHSRAHCLVRLNNPTK